MSNATRERIQPSSIRRWVPYYVKVVVLFGLLFVLSRLPSTLPPFFIALIWAALSAVSTVWLMYQIVVAKLHKQMMLEEGGRLSWLNNGRIFALIIAFVVSAVCMAGVAFEAPKWGGVEWCLVILSAAAFPLVSLGAGRFLGKEYKPLFRTSKAALWSYVIIGAALCILYAVLVLLQPAVSYESATEAFLSVNHPFDGSASTLMSETGKLVALVNGFTAYGVSEAAAISFWGYLCFKMALCVSTFFGIAGLMGFCALGRPELKRVFQPVWEGSSAQTERPLVKRYLAVACALPVCLVAAFFAADFGLARAVDDEGFSLAEGFVRDQVGIAVYVLDGKYYQQQAVQNLIEEGRARSEALSHEAEEALAPLINASYDARLENVDSYLDWYYSLPADYERLGNMIAGTVESYVEEQFTQKIEEGVDDSQLISEFERYSEQSALLESNLMEELSRYEVDDVPEWLVSAKDALDATFLGESLEPTQRLVDSGTRLGISAGAGVGAAIVARLAGKKFIANIVERITGALASRGVAATVGGAGGSIAGPAGAALGVTVGTIVGIGTDYGLLKVDEMQNREQYRAEVVATIEEARADTLAMVRGE